MELQPRVSPKPTAPAFIAVLVSTKKNVIDWVASALSPHGNHLELHVVSCLTSLATYPTQAPVRCLMFESADGFDDAFAMLCAYHVEVAAPVPTLLLKNECTTDDRLRALALGAEDLLDISHESQRTLPLLVGRTAMVAGTQSHLVRNEREFREYLDGSPDAVCIFGDDGVVYANPRFAVLMGALERDASAVRSLADVLPGKTVEAAKARLAEEGAVSAFDVRVGQRRDPQTDMRSDVIVSARLRKAHFEGQRGVLLAMTDVSRERRQETLNKLHSLGEVAAGVAHDFNNFLSAIIGRIGILRRLVNEPQALKSIDVIETAATDASQVVARMRSFARGADDVPHGKVSLTAVARDALEMVRPRASQHQLSHDLEETGEIAGDPSELREVLVNLMNNALDAMPDGGELHLETKGSQHGAFVFVHDTGSGMSEDVKARALEPFFSTKGKAGTGLGLSVSHAIVRRHGGRLQIDSSPGMGTIVTLRFSKL